MTLVDAHTKFIDNLRNAGKANATVIAYGKDIEQLVDFVSKKGKLQSEEVSSEDINEFKEVLSKQRAACAKPNAAFLGVPLKIKFSIFSPRSCLASLSPIIQRRASTILDLPLPLGPTIPTTPAGNSKTVFWAKDLKPLNSRRFKKIDMPNLFH